MKFRRHRPRVQCIVFSRDRPMQLDAFLRSLRRHGPPDLDEPTIIFRVTGENFLAGYEQVRRDHPDCVWNEEEVFPDDVLRMLTTHALTVFHTDDDVYFRKTKQYYLPSNVACFSFRLGTNTRYCYPLDKWEELTEPHAERQWIHWDWRRQGEGSYGYPLALNGHILRTADLRQWIEALEFCNPNELEEGLQVFRDELPSRMAASLHSSVVSIPANIVNETHANRHGGEFTAGDLNERFLRGERIDLDQMDFTNIIGAHQEIPFAFRRART